MRHADRDEPRQSVDDRSYPSRPAWGGVEVRCASALQSAAGWPESGSSWRFGPASERGSAETRRLRRRVVPGVLYGRRRAAPRSASRSASFAGAHGAGGLHAILDVVRRGRRVAAPVGAQGLQQDADARQVAHIDLHEVRLDQPIQRGRRPARRRGRRRQGGRRALPGRRARSTSRRCRSRSPSTSTLDVSEMQHRRHACASPTCGRPKASRSSTIPRRPSSPTSRCRRASRSPRRARGGRGGRARGCRGRAARGRGRGRGSEARAGREDAAG